MTEHAVNPSKNRAEDRIPYLGVHEIDLRSIRRTGKTTHHHGEACEAPAMGTTDEAGGGALTIVVGVQMARTAPKLFLTERKQIDGLFTSDGYQPGSTRFQHRVVFSTFRKDLMPLVGSYAHFHDLLGGLDKRLYLHFPGGEITSNDPKDSKAALRSESTAGNGEDARHEKEKASSATFRGANEDAKISS